MIGVCLLLVSGTPSGAAQDSSAGDDASGTKIGRKLLDIDLSLRVRAETRRGKGINFAREDGIALSRLRLNLTLQPSDSFKVFFQGQDSRVAGLAEGRNSVRVMNPFDVRQVYAVIGSDDAFWKLNVGRQELRFVNDRIVGSRGWSNVSSNWDGMMLTLQKGSNNVRIFGYSIVDIREGLDPVMIPGDTRLYGAISHFESPGAVMDLEPFYFITRKPLNHGSNLGGVLHTYGTRLSRAFKTWDYEVVMAAQHGSAESIPHRAWMGVWGIGKIFEEAPGSPRLVLEWGHASGDHDPTDDRTGTFDILFPSGHRFYGEQDVVGPRNLNSLKTGIELALIQSLRLNFDYYDFRLASTQDGIYRSNHTLGIASPAGGSLSDAIGVELDLFVRYAPVSRMAFRFGVSRFFLGDFVTRNLQQSESQTWLYTTFELRL